MRFIGDSSHEIPRATGDVQKACPRGGGGCAQQGRRRFGARSVLIVREHDKGPTCLREATTAGTPLACLP